MPIYHYYIKDYQGNNRIVAQQNGIIEETNHYYPYGAIFGETAGNNAQPYKYGGKEMERMFGIDLYDFSARMQDPILGTFTSMDPLCEKYYDVSPYSYCSGNPVNRIDPDGRREWPVNPIYNGYGRRHENNFGASRPNGRTHNGVDINHTGGGNTDKGAPIIATHDGTVTRVVVIGSGDTDGGRNRVQITSSDGSVSTYYMHLNDVSSDIQS